MDLLRKMQEMARNAGWRIKWIPWQEPGKVEMVYNTPLTLVTGLGGAAVFIGAMVLAVYRVHYSGKEITRESWP